MFVVYDKKMNKKEFPKGVWPLDIFIHSISKDRVTESVEGRNGIITKGQTHVNRPIEISVGLMAHDTRDYRLLRDEVFSFFDDDVFYISESYQKGKKYKVTILQSYIPNRLNRRTAEMSLLLDMVDLPFAESIGTTQDIQQKGINADDALWGYGMGLIADDEALKYTHTGTSFRIFNAGNVPIHPYEQELKITIDNVQGSSNYLQLRNSTTGDVLRTAEAVNSNQTIVLDGPNVTSNGLQYYRKTNHQFITLAPGWNEFMITGASSARVDFDFKFYYR